MATGPTSASDGRAYPAGEDHRLARHRAARVAPPPRGSELVTTVTSGTRAIARAKAWSSFPAVTPMAVPGRTRSAARRAMASFARRCRARPSRSNPARRSSRRRRGGAAVHLVDKPWSGQRVQIPAHRHVRNFERPSQILTRTAPICRTSSRIQPAAALPASAVPPLVSPARRGCVAMSVSINGRGGAPRPANSALARTQREAGDELLLQQDVDHQGRDRRDHRRRPRSGSGC